MNELIIKNLRNMILNIENIKTNLGKNDWIVATGSQQAYRTCIENLQRNDVNDLLDKRERMIYLADLLEKEINDGKERNKYWVIGWKDAIDNLRFKLELF